MADVDGVLFRKETVADADEEGVARPPAMPASTVADSQLQLIHDLEKAKRVLLQLAIDKGATKQEIELRMKAAGIVQFDFLRLPWEIRRSIYQFLFGTEDIVFHLVCHHYSYNAREEEKSCRVKSCAHGDGRCIREQIGGAFRSSQLLRVSQQIHNEAMPLLYSRSGLIINHHFGAGLAALPYGPELPSAKAEYKNLKLCNSITWPLAAFGLMWEKFFPDHPEEGDDEPNPDVDFGTRNVPISSKLAELDHWHNLQHIAIDFLYDGQSHPDPVQWRALIPRRLDKWAAQVDYAALMRGLKSFAVVESFEAQLNAFDAQFMVILRVDGRRSETKDQIAKHAQEQHRDWWDWMWVFNSWTYS